MSSSVLLDNFYLEHFSPREVEILHLISNGLSNQDIALELHLSVETVKWYNKQIFSKLDVRSRTQAIVKARELGLLSGTM